MTKQLNHRGESPAVRRKLLILAGYPAVGKSTLIRRCVRDRIPLFGSENDHVLLGLREPQTSDEWKLTPEEILEKNYWFSNSHLPFIKKTADHIECAFLHLDLVALVVRTNVLTPTAPLGIKFPRTNESLARDEENRAVISNVFNSHFLKQWDSIAVNTYWLPYAVNCHRFNRRGKSMGELTWLFNGGRQAERIHESINRAWKYSIMSWKTSGLYETTEIEQKLVIRQLIG